MIHWALTIYSGQILPADYTYANRRLVVNVVRRLHYDRLFKKSSLPGYHYRYDNSHVCFSQRAFASKWNDDFSSFDLLFDNIDFCHGQPQHRSADIEI